MVTLSSEMLHATCVAIGGRAVLIEGPSGIGKSDLALRLIDRGATLVADDQTLAMRTPAGLVARAPQTIEGRMEVRGIGIATMPHVAEAPVALLVRLDPEPPRMPERRRRVIAGVEVRVVTLDPPPGVDANQDRARAGAARAGGRVSPAPLPTAATQTILLVTGLSGAGKSTVLKTLEDLGWETVDNMPLALLDRLLAAPPPEGTADDTRPLAIGIGARTRDFDPARIVAALGRLNAQGAREVGLLYLDCAGIELERRYAETRRRHPLALDRPASDGIARERHLLTPLREAATRLIDTTRLSSNQLAQTVRETYGGDGLGEPTLSVMSFGFARGVPTNADLVFDMRFLRNPHWEPALRPGTGLDPAVAAYVQADPAYEPAVSRIEDLLELLIPRYRAEGKAYVTVAIGCTGGRHRSVHVADRIARRLQDAGFSPTITHRDLGTAPQDSLEGPAQGLQRG